ncbi:MAG TPA: GDSL-type esterase/lipase family protein [Planctomycetota bacterium]
MKILARIPIYLGVVASLLVFPAGVPWMALGWILLFGVELLRGRPSWIFAALPLVLILVKRVDWPLALPVLLLLLAASASGARRLAVDRRRAAAALAVLLLGWTWVLWAWSDAARTSRRPSFDPDRPIVCVGDSLTAYAYPRELQNLVAAKVVDHGVGGTTAAQGLEALSRTLALKPQAVLIEFGGHDYLRDRTRDQTRASLDAMIRACREAGAEVILFEIPRGFLYDPFGGLERQLARAHDLELVTDGAIRSLILRSPWFPVRLGEPLSYDGLHPNEAGNAHLARAAAAALARVYGPAAIRPGRGWY